MSKSGISRRDFLKGAAVGAVSVASLGVLGACNATPAPSADPGATAPAPSSPVNAAAQSEYMTAEKAAAKWAFEIAPDPIPESDIKETITADVIVVGAGAAGLVTANSAIEQGLDVIVVCAGKTHSARGGSNNAVYCKALEKAGVPRVSPTMFEKEIFCNVNKVDAKKWYKHYNNNEEAANWAIDIMEGAGYGVTVEYGTPMNADNLYYQATAAIGWELGEGMELEEGMVNMTGMMQPLFTKTLTERLSELGGRIDFNTIGKQLERENNNTGRVTSLIALREDGTYARYVGKKAVVLATGDFSADRDMMAKYCPDAANLVYDTVYDGEAKYDIGFQYGGLMKGDGQKMGLWVGAAWQKFQNNCPMVYPTIAGPGLLYGNHWGLMVNRDGERFMNEYALAPMAGYTAQAQPGGEVCAIWDSAYPRYVRTTGGWNNDSAYSGSYATSDESEIQATLDAWDEQVAKDEYVKADTLEELIEKLGLPASTIDTVNHYTEMAHAGADTEYYKNSAVLCPIEQGPFYGHRNTVSFGFLTVLGGLRTNANMQVCDEDDNAIPGLYNVGTMVGDMYNGTYTFQIEGANYGMTCLTFGYMTGKFIAENE